MRIGVIFPQTEIGNDPAVIRDFAQAAEELGYAHLFVYDHVLGTNPEREGYKGFYSSRDAFHEPFVLFGYLAGLTKTIEFASGVIILPQRQAVLVAKQAAQVAVLAGGRIRLGIGTGWNQLEYEALGVPFEHRGAREAEQVELMRRLWREDTLTFEGKWHTVHDSGINPRPAVPVPVWFGGGDERVLKRAARLGDGWMPGGGVGQLGPAVERLRGYLAEEGRDPATFGLESRVAYGDSPDDWNSKIDQWKELGGTHLAVNLMGFGLATPAAQIEALRRFAAETGIASRV